MTLVNSKHKLVTLLVLSVNWLSFLSGQLIHFIFTEDIFDNLLLNVTIIGCIELIASFASKIPLSYLKRSYALLACNVIMIVGYFTLIVLDFDDQA